MHSVLFGIFLVTAVVAKHEIYEGFSIYKVTVNDITHAEELKNIISQVYADVWTYALPDRPGQILVAGDKKQLFEELLDEAGVEYQIEVENVKEFLDLEDKLLARTESESNNTFSGRINFDRIYTYDEVDEYLEELAAKHPNIVTLVNGGSSFEGRPIKYLKISTTNFQDENKPIIFIESLIHAREWITLPVTLYAIEKLVVDVQDQDLVQDIDWIILPIVNPDGYVYTHEWNRLWRKNKATGYMIGNLCTGVDLNRNFDYIWSSYSSRLVCSETFHGKAAFSEPETAIIRDIMMENLGRLELFLDIHSFGSMILYGYGSGDLPPNGLMLHVIGTDMATAIDSVKMTWNPYYTVGNVAEILYNSSGDATDFAQSIGVPLSFTFELPGYRYSLGTGIGFLVDPKFIEQAGFETWEGIKIGARFARDHYGKRNE